MYIHSNSSLSVKCFNSFICYHLYLYHLYLFYYHMP
nr:MAG TPA: hypothetical protein [Caudoviricetes sp.]